MPAVETVQGVEPLPFSHVTIFCLVPPVSLRKHLFTRSLPAPGAITAVILPDPPRQRHRCNNLWPGGAVLLRSPGQRFVKGFFTGAVQPESGDFGNPLQPASMNMEEGRIEVSLAGIVMAVGDGESIARSE